MQIQVKHNDVYTPEIVYENYIEDKLEQELIIPDYLCSALKILHCEAEAMVYDKNISDDKIVLEGTCVWKIIYVSEEDSSLHSIQCERSFTEHFSTQTVGTLRYKIKTKNVICKLIGPQKVSCKATLCLALQLSSNKCSKVVCDISDEVVEKKVQTKEIQQPIVECEREFKTACEIPLKHRKDCVVYKATSVFQIKERKCAQGTLVLKGVCKTKAVLLGCNERFAETIESETTFSQVFEIDEVTPECTALVMFPVSSCDCSINEDTNESVLLIQTVATAQISVFCAQEIPVLQDAYHPNAELLLSETETSYFASISSFDLSVRCQQNIPMKTDGVDVLYHEAFGEVDKISVQDDLMIVDGKILVVLVCASNDDVFKTTYSMPFQTTRKSDDAYPRIKCDAAVYLDSISYLITSDSEIEISCECRVSVCACMMDECKTIGQIELQEISDECKNNSPLILYYAEQGETLWEIGKKYHVSQRALKENNNLLMDRLEESCLLLVCKK